MSVDVSPDFDPQKPKRSWKKFQRLSVDRQGLSRKMRRAETATTKHAQRFLVKRIDSLRESRKYILSWLIAVTVILLGIAGQVVWSHYLVTKEAPSSGGTYAEGIVGKIDTLNPLYASSSPEVAASKLLFSSLYTYDETGKLHPDLAQSATANEKGDSYTIKIRKNAKWHDGEPLTAADVAFTVSLINNREARVRSSLRANWQDIKVKALDKYTLRINLPAPYAAFPHALTFPVVPKHILSRIAPGAVPESAFGRSPVGSGPFTYRLLQASDAISGVKTMHAIANEKYYGEAPRLGRFEIHAYPHSDALVRALQAGEVTAAAGLSATQSGRLTNEGYISHSTPVDNGLYALINNTHPILKDVKMREALRYAVDPASIRRMVGGGVEPLDLPFLNKQVSGSESLKAPRTDAAKSAAILDSLGWKLTNGVRAKEGKPLKIKITATKSRQYEQVAEQIRDQLKQVGIKAEINIIDDKSPKSNFIQDVLQARNYEILIYELPIGADPDVYAYWHSSQLGISGYNFTNYSSGISDAALASARDRLDPALRNAKYISFAKQWLKDVPAIGLYQQSLTYVHKSNATAMDNDARFVSASDRYANISHWTVNRERVYKTP